VRFGELRAPTTHHRSNRPAEVRVCASRPGGGAGPRGRSAMTAPCSGKPQGGRRSGRCADRSCAAGPGRAGPIAARPSRLPWLFINIDACQRDHTATTSSCSRVCLRRHWPESSILGNRRLSGGVCTSCRGLRVKVNSSAVRRMPKRHIPDVTQPSGRDGLPGSRAACWQRPITGTPFTDLESFRHARESSSWCLGSGWSMSRSGGLNI
jgi:hypothetical protein